MLLRMARTSSTDLPSGSVRSQSMYFFPGMYGHSSPHPIVTTTSAHWPRSSVNFCGRCADRSMPCSRITSTTTAWTCSAGRVPAERAWWRPLAARSKRAWLICDRPAFCAQTNSTRTTASSDEHVEQRAGLRLEMAREPVVGPDAGLADVDQPCITQLRHVMGERRL